MARQLVAPPVGLGVRLDALVTRPDVRGATRFGPSRVRVTVARASGIF
jgi:hypothetical protein